MNRTFIDTFFLIALANERDAHHERALQLAELYNGCPTLTTEAVLIETGNALGRAFRHQSIRIISEILQSTETEIVWSNEDLFAQAFALYMQHADKSWGLTDCISFVAMGDRGIGEALTGDRHFAQAGLIPLFADVE